MIGKSCNAARVGRAGLEVARAEAVSAAWRGVECTAAAATKGRMETSAAGTETAAMKSAAMETPAVEAAAVETTTAVEAAAAMKTTTTTVEAATTATTMEAAAATTARRLGKVRRHKPYCSAGKHRGEHRENPFSLSSPRHLFLHLGGRRSAKPAMPRESTP